MQKLLLLLLFCFFAHFARAQYEAAELRADSMENQLDKSESIAQLTLLLELSEYYANKADRKGIKYGKQAVTMSENLLQAEPANTALLEMRGQATFRLAVAQFNRGDYRTAKNQLIRTKTNARISNSQALIDRADEYLNLIDSLEESGEVRKNILSEKLDNFKVKEEISGTLDDMNFVDDVKAKAEIGLAKSKAENGEIQAAIKHYENAIAIYNDKGASAEAYELELRIVELLKQSDQAAAAERLDGLILKEETLLAEPPAESPTSEVTTEEPKTELKAEQKNLLNLSREFEAKNDFEKSLSYFKRYTDLTQRMREDSLKQENLRANRLREITLLKQEKEIANLGLQAAEAEQERQQRQRNTSIAIAGLLLLMALGAAWLYFNQRRQNARLNIAYKDLNKVNGKLQSAEQNILKLLNQQVSGEIANELLRHTGDKPIERRFVCVMFLDIRDFTPMAERMQPEELIEFQNKVFGFMIDAVQHHHGNINQFLGDGFMATFGAPVSHGNDCENAFNAAQEILAEIKERSTAGIIPPIRVGIGLHAGHVVTGNVGTDIRKQYSITGNTVILAARVEQLNKQYKSQLILTDAVFKQLENAHGITKDSARETNVKGRQEPIRIFAMG